MTTMLRPGQRMVHLPGIGITTSRRAVSAATANWWEAGGATGCVAAYQPKGAASLAASYSNLANPGTYDAAPGVAPTWDATNGWIFSGSQYLTTGSAPIAHTYTVAVVFTGAPSAVQVIFGYFGALAFRIIPNRLTNGVGYGQTYVAPGLAAGVLVLAGQNGYRNGSLDTAAANVGSGTSADPYIAAQNQGGPVAYYAGNIQALGIWNNVLDGTKAAAVSTAMAAL